MLSDDGLRIKHRVVSSKVKFICALCVFGKLLGICFVVIRLRHFVMQAGLLGLKCLYLAGKGIQLSIFIETEPF